MNVSPAPRIKSLAAILLCLAFAAAFMMPATAHAQEDSGKTVHVGWYDSSFNTVDKYGRRSGYSYEYQLKIAAYTGSNYKYVEGSWSDLMDMLRKGEIDLMSDVSYTPERAKTMLFASLPMGTEEYYLFSARDKQEAISSDYSFLNGKKVGVNKDSVQADFLREWAKKQKIQPDIVEVTCTEDESLAMLETGELVAYVTVDSFADPESAAPICKIGSSDFFFAVNKKRPDLLGELNAAMDKIQDENRYYNERMFEKHIKRAGANAFLASDEAQWLSERGAIRVGYLDNYLAFCAEDKATGAQLASSKTTWPTPPIA